jgi:hypothetical protein
MGRQYDESGMNHWLNQLNLGLSRDGLLGSFSSSSEFSVLAEAYGIVAYEASTSPTPSDDPVEGFVSRFYTEVLGRSPDSDGLNNWVNQLESNSSTADDIANGFFFSQEFLNKNTSNNEFINIAYKTLLGRDADVSGLDNWISHLANGMGRADMLDGFIYSQEFSTLANEYGINVGEEPELPDEPLPEAAPWDELVGEYSLYNVDITTPDGSSLHISPSGISSIQGELTASLSIGEDGGFDFYFDLEDFDAVGYMDATIQSVSDSEIFYYDHDLNEYDDINYTLTDPVLTIYDQQDGYNFSMGWVLL